MWFPLVYFGLLAVRADSLAATSDALDAQTLRGGRAKHPLPLQHPLPLLVKALYRKDGGMEANRITNVLPITHFVQQQQPKPKVFFLFLTMSGIHRPELWDAFFDQQPANQYRVFLHCKDPEACRLQSSLTSSWKIYQMAQQVRTVPSSYCTDLVTPMVELLDAARWQSESSYDKFVFVSDATVPVKPFSEVYTTLTSYSDSDMCIHPKDEWGEATAANGQASLIIKSGQWVVLNQEHAIAMVQKWPAAKGNFVGAWSLPVFLKGPWGSTAIPNDFSHRCVDEYAFFAMMFGAVVDLGQELMSKEDLQGYGGLPLQIRGNPWITKASQGICRTFAFWDAGHVSISEELAQDPNTKFSCYPSCTSSSPASFAAISDLGVGVLRRSPYLFARKFSGNVLSVDQFKRIVLSATPPTPQQFDNNATPEIPSSHMNTTASGQSSHRQKRESSKLRKRTLSPLQKYNDALADAVKRADKKARLTAATT